MRQFTKPVRNGMVLVLSIVSLRSPPSLSLLGVWPHIPLSLSLFPPLIIEPSTNKLLANLYLPLPSSGTTQPTAWVWLESIHATNASAPGAARGPFSPASGNAAGVAAGVSECAGHVIEYRDFWGGLGSMGPRGRMRARWKA